jgi:hypothetical protein
MKPIINKLTGINIILLLLISLNWIPVQGCEITQDDNGLYIFRDCYLRTEHLKMKMADLQVTGANISIASGGGTGLFINFSVTNRGTAATDSGLVFKSGYSLYNMSKGFNVESTVYVVSEDHSFNMHYDNDIRQWMPYSQQTQRVSRLDVGDSQAISFGSPGNPRFYLHDRNLTYKVGVAIKVDEPQTSSGSTRGLTHGEIVESDESNNDLTLECLVYGSNISDLSEIFNVRHFHINNDLNLPMISPCY